MKTSRYSAILVIAVIGLSLYLFAKHITAKPYLSKTTQSRPQNSELVSTDPSPLDGAIIAPNQTIKFTFKKGLDHQSFTVHIDPDIKYRVDFNPDNTSITIVPTESWQFGQDYTINLPSGTKFEDGSTLGDQDLIYHIRTIQYSGV